MITVVASLVCMLTAQGSSNDPFVKLPLPPAAELRQQLQSKGSFSADGNELIVVYQAPAAESVELQIALQTPLDKVPGTDDLWALRLEVPRLPEAVVSYGFLVTRKGADPKMENMGVFRGEKADPPLEMHKDLDGTYLPLEIESKALGQKRKFAVYLPPSKVPVKGKLFAIYAGDGACKPLAQVMEPYIEAGTLPPLAIIGIESGGNKRLPSKIKEYDMQLDARAHEYLRNIDPELFDKHLEFFSGEVVRLVEKKFPQVGGSPSKRAVLGWSNGGVFAADAGLRKGDVFGLAVPLSLGVMPDMTKRPKRLPQFYVASGILEPGFFKQSSTFAKTLMDWKTPVKFNDRVSGHDLEMWKSEAVKAVAWYFNLPSPVKTASS